MKMNVKKTPFILCLSLSLPLLREKEMKIYYIPQNIKSEHIAMKVLLLLLLLAAAAFVAGLKSI
jgi:hypothetical protein